MKLYIPAFLLLLLAISCKKKDDPQPAQADKPVYQTSFDDNTWRTYTGKHYTSGYSSNQYKIALDTINWFGYESAPTNDINYTYSIEADITTVLDDPSQLGYGGLIYNKIDQNNYCILNIGTNGSFYAYQVENGTGKQLIYTTVSTALIKGSGQLNHIKIKQRTNSLELIFNSVSQGTFPFQIPTQLFKTGLTANSGSTHYTPMHTLFDNFVLKEIY